MPTWLTFLLFFGFIAYMLWKSGPFLKEAASERKKHSKGYKALDSALLVSAALIVIAAMLGFIIWAEDRGVDKGAKKLIGLALILGVSFALISLSDKLLKKFSRKRIHQIQEHKK
jgi:hypothetical protein